MGCHLSLFMQLILRHLAVSWQLKCLCVWQLFFCRRYSLFGRVAFYRKKRAHSMENSYGRHCNQITDNRHEAKNATSHCTRRCSRGCRWNVGKMTTNGNRSRHATIFSACHVTFMPFSAVNYELKLVSCATDFRQRLSWVDPFTPYAN